MGEHKIASTTVRAAIKAAFQRRTERHMPSAARFRRVPYKARLSTRGEPGDTWNTKRWTDCRKRMRSEAFELRAKMARDAAEKAKSKAEHITRQGDDPHPRDAYEPVRLGW